VWEPKLELPAKWNIGLIVGPSGSGKTTLLHEAFGDPVAWSWSTDRAVVDDFPKGLPIATITGALSAVGFSSPPAWLRPYHTLSNGEQFRVGVARALLEAGELIVLDEFTSVVDRTVAQIGSAAVAKFIRRSERQLVVASCHFDIIDWLQPDWVYDCGTGQYTGRSLQPRPDIELEVARTTRDTWRIFRKHHYLTGSIHTAAISFVGMIDDRPIVFGSAVHFPHPTVRDMYRGHRTVVLPDYQGVGIGNRFTEMIASLFRERGYRYSVVFSHPAMIRHCARSPLWKLTRRQGTVAPSGSGEMNHSDGRWTAAFEYVGAPASHEDADALLGGLTLTQLPPQGRKVTRTTRKRAIARVSSSRV
jgi:GNAT superfamily N-acetyltransferase